MTKTVTETAKAIESKEEKTIRSILTLKDKILEKMNDRVLISSYLVRTWSNLL